jgi:SNF2 family DNA or RNA helicase
MRTELDLFPTSIDLLKEQHPHFVFSKKLISPILVLEKCGDRYKAGLAGMLFKEGSRTILPAQSNYYDWVLDGNLVRPLPKGICEELKLLAPNADLMDLSFSQMLALVRDDQDIIEVSYDDAIFSSAKIDASALETENFSIPGLNARLFPYQAQGVLWMHQALKSHGGIILADEMGLGKTIQIISLLLLDPPNSSTPALIVAPTTLLKNWERELLKFAPTLTHCIHHGPLRSGFYKTFKNYNIIITSYSTVSEDMAMFSAFEWRYLICDEAQAIKNPSSERRMNINSLHRKYAIPMTGTPVENSLRDLWSLTDFAIPGLLGSEDDFETHFPDDEEAARNVSQITDPIVLRRRVADVAGDLPERIDIPVPLMLDTLHAKEYCHIRQSAFEEYEKAGGLVAAGRLQMFCTHPWLQRGNSDVPYDTQILNSDSAMPFMNPKLERTKEILLEAFSCKKKVLIFVTYNKCGELIKRTLDGRGDLYWNAINGTTPANDRQKICDEFEAFDGDACLVLNPRAAGAGLNITAATVVIHFSPFWNPAHELQASARAYRRGQNHPVTIFMLFYEQTLEEVMIERAELRRNLGNEALTNKAREQEDLHRAMHIYPGVSYE